MDEKIEEKTNTIKIWMWIENDGRAIIQFLFIYIYTYIHISRKLKFYM